MQNPYFKEKLISIKPNKKEIKDLIFSLKDTAYQGRKLGEAFFTWKKMLEDKNVTIILGLAGSMSTAGMWKMIKWLIEKNYVDVIVSTGANISEDIYEAMGFSYWKGSPNVNDEELFKYGIDRFYDAYASEKDYEKMEQLILEFSRNIKNNENLSSREYLWKFGEFLFNKKILSIVTSCYIKKLPIYSPTIIDSAYGISLLNLKKKEKRIININTLLDLEELSKIVAYSKKTGVIYIGGGVPKDFIQISTILAPLFKKGNRTKPHNYAIQITTDSPQWGGLSGCSLEEAVSWGKVSSDALKVTCNCDATIALPILIHGILELNIERKPSLDFNKILE